jgi:hypothetical protein
MILPYKVVVSLEWYDLFTIQNTRVILETLLDVSPQIDAISRIAQTGRHSDNSPKRR